MPLKNERGSLILIIILIVAVLSAVYIAATVTQTSGTQTLAQMNYIAQADNIARGGLVDTITWFRNQPEQPARANWNTTLFPYADAAFAPQAATGDTIDQTIGLVKEYAISSQSNLWARYEIWQQPDPGSNPYNSHAVHDITNQRIPGHVAGEGLAWYIESVGYVYEKLDSTKNYNQSPNKIIGSSRVSTEIRRLSLTLPASAAVIVNNEANVTLTNNGRIIGPTGYTALAYYSTSGSPSISGGGSYAQGTPNYAPVAGSTVTTPTNFQSIFGVLPSELKMMSDIDINSLSPMPASYPSMAIVYIERSATFDGTTAGTIQLIGGGILYVNGNLTVTANSNTLFSGLIYVTGNVSITGPADISGCLIAGGTITLDGGSDVAQITYDNTIINSVRNQVGLYRENKSTFFQFSGGK